MRITLSKTKEVTVYHSLITQRPGINKMINMIFFLKAKMANLAKDENESFKCQIFYEKQFIFDSL